MSNSKKYLLIAILALYGQIAFSLWSYQGNYSVTLRAIFISFSIKFLGDFLGRFVFKMEQYDWVYIRNYLQDNLMLRLPVLVLFTMFWLVPILFVDFWGMKGSLIDYLLGGGLIPALYYWWINRDLLTKSATTAHRLRRKL